MTDIKNILNEIKADAFLIIDPLNMQYLSGFTGGEGALYISENMSVLITDSRYTESAAKETDFQIVEEKASHRRKQILSECIAKDNAKVIGFEDMTMTVHELQKYRADLSPELKWTSIGTVIDRLRMIKKPDEIAWMKKAADIADTAFEKMLGIIKPGMTELDGAAELEYQMKKLGAEGVSFSTIFAAGKNSSMPHAVPTDYIVQNGDFITMDFGCKVNGYCSDMTRTVAVGNIDEEKRKVYETVLKANKDALAAVKAGMKACDVDKIARDIIKEAGYGQYFGHATGHSVGLAIHEEPRISPNDGTVLVPNMIETIEPGIYLPGQFGVRIEDMIMVTKDGYMNFVRSDKELIIL